MATTKNLIISLEQWTSLQIKGPDSLHFLHQQLTNSVEDIPTTKSQEIARQAHVRLAGYCSPKGRLMASMWLVRDQEVSPSGPMDRITAYLSQDVATTIAKRLKMFVLRSKVDLVLDTATHRLWGLINPDQETLERILTKDHISVTELPSVHLNETHHQRYLVRCPQEINLQEAIGTLSFDDLGLWNQLEVMSGIARITQATYEQFVPQMVNFESVGGIHFQKGCYPGQEVVARSQYRGTIKRRLAIAQVKTQEPPVPGTEIYDETDPHQPCGMVVLSCPKGDGVQLVQVECKTESLDHPIHMGQASGPSLSFFKLPYPLAEI